MSPRWAHGCRIWGASLAEVRRAIALMAVEIIPFDAEQAYAAAGIRSATHVLSLGDLSCVQLATRRGLPAVTADRAWAELAVDVEVTADSRLTRSASPDSRSRT